MPIALKAHPYYRFDRLLSYNGTYNFLVGSRGEGKTYGAKERAIKKFLKDGEQFIYLRRYKTELRSRSTFFADIARKFPNWDFRIVGMLAQCAPVATRDEKKREWRTMGYFVALSTSQANKSIAYPLVTTIIFDEFIIEKGSLHYIPDESNVFNNFYSTVDRYQDKTRVFFLANSVSIMNPYFLAYDIRPDESNEFIVRFDGFVVCHFTNAESFQSSVYETKFGRFIKGTEYADYAVGNTFSDNNENLLLLKDSKSKYIFSLETKNGKFSVWNNAFTGEYFIQERIPNGGVLFTLEAERMSEDKIYITFNDRPLQHLRTAFRNAKVMFDKPATRNTFVEIFKR